MECCMQNCLCEIGFRALTKKMTLLSGVFVPFCLIFQGVVEIKATGFISVLLDQLRV